MRAIYLVLPALVIGIGVGYLLGQRDRASIEANLAGLQARMQRTEQAAGDLRGSRGESDAARTALASDPAPSPDEAPGSIVEVRSAMRHMSMTGGEVLAECALFNQERTAVRSIRDEIRVRIQALELAHVRSVTDDGSGRVMEIGPFPEEGARLRAELPGNGEQSARTRAR